MKGKLLEMLSSLRKKVKSLSTTDLQIIAIASGIVMTTLIVVVLGVATLTSSMGSDNAKDSNKSEVAGDADKNTLNKLLPHSTDDADTILNDEVFIAKEEMSEEAILDMIDASARPVELISYENLNIGADTSSKPVAKAEVGEETVNNSTSSYEYSGIVKGIDVSKWQGNIDWSQVAASGVQFAIIKCAGRSTAEEGTLYEDSKFERNIQGAIANGIQVGVYFFSQARTTQEAYEEASMTVQLIRKYQITYPVVFDWESAAGYRVAGQVGRRELTDICHTFAGVVGSYGYSPMIYFNRSDWRTSVYASELTGRYKTWLAYYPSRYYGTGELWDYGKPVPQYPDIPYNMWQYTSTGSVPGISGNVDMDIAFFGYGNYEVDGMQEACINLATESFNLVCGKDEAGNDLPESPIEGVDYMAYIRANANAKNCIGYDADLTITITDSAGNERDYWDAIHSEGQYSINYSFVDPKNGLITRSASLYVASRPTEAETETETETETESETESESETDTETETGSETDAETDTSETTSDETAESSNEASQTESTEETSEGESQNPTVETTSP